MMDIAGLMVCGRCVLGFAPDDVVVMAVPFQQRGERLLMGDELLMHEGCEPLPRGLREVGRGRFREVLAGVRSGSGAAHLSIGAADR
jgi:hypothetical protein